MLLLIQTIKSGFIFLGNNVRIYTIIQKDDMEALQSSTGGFHGTVS